MYVRRECSADVNGTSRFNIATSVSLQTWCAESGSRKTVWQIGDDESLRALWWCLQEVTHFDPVAQPATEKRRKETRRLRSRRSAPGVPAREHARREQQPAALVAAFPTTSRLGASRCVTRARDAIFQSCKWRDSSRQQRDVTLVSRAAYCCSPSLSPLYRDDPCESPHRLRSRVDCIHT